MIQINLQGKNIPETFCLTNERAEELDTFFADTTEQWQESEDEQTTAYLLARMAGAAKTPNEQLYAVYHFGRHIGSNYTPNILAAITKIINE